MEGDEQTWSRSRLIGCGCLLTLLLCFTCTGGTCHHAFKEVVVVDPVKVEAMADRILPGARPPDGFRGTYASRLARFEMALIKENNDAGMAFQIFGMRRPEDVTKTRWESFEPHVRKLPGQWGPEKSHEFVEQMVDGRSVQARRYRTTDGALGYRYGLFTRRRAVMLQVVGPEETFDEKIMRSFLYRLDLDREPPPRGIGGLPFWLLGMFAVMGIAGLTVGAYIVTELGQVGGDREDEHFDL